MVVAMNLRLDRDRLASESFGFAQLTLVYKHHAEVGHRISCLVAHPAMALDLKLKSPAEEFLRFIEFPVVPKLQSNLSHSHRVCGSVRFANQRFRLLQFALAYECGCQFFN